MKFLLRSFLLALSLFTSLQAQDPLLQLPKDAKQYSVVVLGGGIGGLTSALYLARAGLNPLVIEGTTPGGLLRQSHWVQNWPGEIGIKGADLIEKVRHQAQESGAEFLTEDVAGIDFSKDSLLVFTRPNEAGELRQIQAHACIIAMGTEPNFLGVSGETGSEGYWGRGVTNCAICDGPLYRDQVVGVVGGGDAAVLEALYLSNIAKEVNVFVRRGSLKAIEKTRVKTLLERPNVKIFYDTEVVSIQGDQEKLTGVVLKHKNKKTSEFPLDGLFLAIGSRPNSSLFQNALQLDKAGYIVLEKDQQTSKKGVYAIGDIVDPVYKQAISAAGDGAKAALQAQRFLEDLGDIGKENKSVSIEKKEVPSLDSTLIEVSSVDQFEKELIEGDRLLVVDFYSPWCGPCKHVSPLLDSLAENIPSKVKILKVNIAQYPSLAKFYNIRSIPTVLVFNPSGKLVERKSGLGEVTQLIKQIETDFDEIASR